MAYNSSNYTEQGGENTVIGGSLTVNGKLYIGSAELKQAENQADSTATSVADLKTNFNALLAKLIAAGLMESGSDA